MSRRSVVLGDVFTLPIDSVHVGFGQVVGMYGEDNYFFAIFNHTAEAAKFPDDLDEALKSGVALLALSFDAKIHAGHWKIVGNKPVSDDIPMPAYKQALGSAHNMQVVDFSGNLARKATIDEVAILPNRTVFAPAILELALKAKLSPDQWRDAFTPLLPNDATTTKRMFSKTAQ